LGILSIFLFHICTRLAPFTDESLLDYSESELEGNQDSPGKDQMEVDISTPAADPQLKCLGSEKKTNSTAADPLPQGRDSSDIVTRTNADPPRTATGSAIVAATAAPADETATATTPDTALGNGFNENLYQAIRKLRAATLAPRQLGDCAAAASGATLVSAGTINMYRCHYRNIYDSKMNISFSFEPRGLTCFNCAQGPHHILGEEYQPACVILTDQHFPAALPASGNLRCPAIIRAEDATLSDLLSCFRKTMGKSKMPVGSVVMIGSLSHLARVGTAAYATDLQSALTTLEEEYGNRIRTVHMLPVPNADVEDEVAIRALYDILEWLDNVDKRAKYCLPELQSYMKLNLVGDGEPNHLHRTRIPLRLPAGFKSKEMAAFCFGGTEDLVRLIPRYEGQLLLGHLTTLLQELNNTFAVNLDTKPDLSGKVSGHQADNQAENGFILVAGSSHASRLAASLGTIHTNMVDLSISGWKLSEANVKSLSEDISEKLEEHGQEGGAVILQLFDNSIFGGQREDGTVRPAFRFEGRYHIEGELVTISKDDLKDLFELAVPIFRAARNAPTYIIGPLPRYVTGPCCGNPEHVSNMDEADFTEVQAAAVRDLGRYLRQLVWHKRWKNVVVVNPADLMGIGGSFSAEEEAIRMEDVRDLWGEEDPVHPTKQAYTNMATGLLEQVASKWATAEKGEKKTTRGIKRPSDEYLGRRPDWAAASVTAVARKPGFHGSGQRGGHRVDTWGRQKYQRRGDGDYSPRPGGSGREGGSGDSRGEGGYRNTRGDRTERGGGSRPAREPREKRGGGARRGGWGGW